MGLSSVLLLITDEIALRLSKTIVVDEHKAS